MPTSFSGSAAQAPEGVELVSDADAAVEGALDDGHGRPGGPQGQVRPLAIQQQLLVAPPCRQVTLSHSVAVIMPPVAPLLK